MPSPVCCQGQSPGLTYEARVCVSSEHVSENGRSLRTKLSSGSWGPGPAHNLAGLTSIRPGISADPARDLGQEPETGLGPFLERTWAWAIEPGAGVTEEHPKNAAL